MLQTIIGMSSKNKKCSSLAPPGSNPIDINFQLHKSLETFDKKSAVRIQSQNYKGGKSALPHAN